MQAHLPSIQFRSLEVFETCDSALDHCPFEFLGAGHQAGVDEVGIGPLAGPVTAAAVIFSPDGGIAGLADSKVLTHKRREVMSEEIKARSLCWSLGWADVAEIDTLNILRASHLAMRRAIAGLQYTPTLVMVDGNKTPNSNLPSIAVVQGDRRIPQISAASILAKVARDEYMCRLHQQYPDYGFAQHKGYPTRQHMQALDANGVTPYHRRSFAPVQKVLSAADPEVTAPAKAMLS